VRTAAALVIGNELLSGKIGDANVLVLARALRALGVRLSRVVMILDDVTVIASEVRALAAAHDWVFTSGGVGPTHDDLTVEGVAAAFGARVETSPELTRMLEQYYGDRITESHKLMARVPAGARLVTRERSPWPAIVMRNVWVLPGVPQIFEMKMALVREELGGDTPFLSLAVFTSLDEGQLKPMLDRVVDAFADIDIGSYPQWGDADARTKLTFDGLAADRVRAARDAFVQSLPAGSVLRAE
jgi:molybdenum cofactor synthesis domain-containing protein